MAPQNVELMSALATLLEAGKYSDLTILCGTKEYHVHRAIICSRSGFFDGACSNPFREAETGIIDLSEDDAEAVEHMVHYFYHLDYLTKAKSRHSSRGSTPTSSRPVSPISRRTSRKLNLALVEDPLLAQMAANANAMPQQEDPRTPPMENTSNPFDFTSKVPPPDSAIELLDAPFEFTAVPEQEPDTAQPYLTTHAKVYAIAEKYGIKGLKSLARSKFSSQAALHWTSEEFAEVMDEVYVSTVDTDRGLRDIIVQAFRQHPELARRKDVEGVVKQCPGLAWELFKVGWGMPVS